MTEHWIDIIDIVLAYKALVEFSAPIVFVFGMGNILFDLFTGAAFDGVLRIGGRR